MSEGVVRTSDDVSQSEIEEMRTMLLFPEDGKNRMKLQSLLFDCNGVINWKIVVTLALLVLAGKLSYRMVMEYYATSNNNIH